MNRIVGVNTNCYHGYSVEDALEGIAAAGFHHVELTATKGWTEHVFPSRSFDELLDVKELMGKLNLNCAGMSGHCNLMDPERLGDFERNMELAAFFGADFIVSSVGEAHLEDRRVSGTAALVENILSFGDRLERLGLTLVLETHGDHAAAGVLGEIVRGIDSPRVRIAYDTANVIFYGDVDPHEDIRLCLDYVGYVHLKDKAGGRREWNFPALGRGYVRFPEIFALLDSAGNDAPFSIEIEFTEEGPASLDEVNRALAVSREYLEGRGIRI